MREHTCCFTGHRRIANHELATLKERLERQILLLHHQGVNDFMAGGALGFDTLAALTVLGLKISHPGLRLILVLPCLEQCRGWPEADCALYEQIKEQADAVVYTARDYQQGCMLKRNRYLVDHSHYCICYLKHNSGGTYYTVNYARGQGLPVVNLISMEQL